MRRLDKRLVLAALMGLLPLVAGCAEQGPAERAGERIDEGVERAGEKIEEAGEEVRDAAGG